MKLIRETKTYKIEFREVLEVGSIAETIDAYINSMPEWSLVDYICNYDKYYIEFTVRRSRD
jgi:hypothetical protein